MTDTSLILESRANWAPAEGHRLRNDVIGDNKQRKRSIGPRTDVGGTRYYERSRHTANQAAPLWEQQLGRTVYLLKSPKVDLFGYTRNTSYQLALMGPSSQATGHRRWSTLDPGDGYERISA